MKQVDANHYAFDAYCGIDRWSSYYYQLKEVLSLNPTNILEVGVGDGTFARQIRSLGISYTGVDGAEDVGADIVADIKRLPFEDNSFDVVCAFEVLEHLPFDQFTLSLKELSRVSRKNVVISIPHFGPPILFRFKIPFFPTVSFAWKIPFYKKHVFNGEHYWEVGKRGYSGKDVRKKIEEIYFLNRHFIPFENQYHHFYLLRKKTP